MSGESFFAHFYDTPNGYQNTTNLAYTGGKSND